MKNTIFKQIGWNNANFPPTFLALVLLFSANGCKEQKSPDKGTLEPLVTSADKGAKPDTIYGLTRDLYTADPSAHVFNGKIYVYPSHDFEAGIPEDDLGSHFGMEDYHVYSMDHVGGEVTDHGRVLHVDDVLWAGRQMWAPDAAQKGEDFYLYFPVKDKEDIFRIGVAHSKNPEGPFLPQDRPIAGSYSMDPAVFKDSDGKYYMYFGGIWGGQLQKWDDNRYHGEDRYPGDDQPALSPRVALMGEDMVSFAEDPRPVLLLDESGSPITTGDNDRRFFEAAW